MGFKRTMTIVKKDGQVATIDAIKEQLECMLDSVADGYYELTFSKRKRSNEQNNLMWKWFTIIADECGCSPQDVHDLFCKRFLVRVVEINGKDEFLVGGTSTLKTDEMNEFLNKIELSANEMGIQLPSYNDLENFFL